MVGSLRGSTMISGFLSPLGSFSLRFSFGTLASQLGFPDYSQDYKHKSHHDQFVVCKYQKAELLRPTPRYKSER